jgi:hypothetical protein
VVLAARGATLAVSKVVLNHGQGLADAIPFMSPNGLASGLIVLKLSTEMQIIPLVICALRVNSFRVR